MIPLGLGLSIGVPNWPPTCRPWAASWCSRPTDRSWPRWRSSQTGSTRIGQYVFNHSFIVPTLVMVVVSVVVAILLGLLIG